MASRICERCGGENDRSDEQIARLTLNYDTRIDARWCRACEHQYQQWLHEHAGDVVWQLGGAGMIAIGIGLFGVLAGAPVIALGALLLGPTTFAGLRSWNRTRRKSQFLASAMPRAYLAPPR